MAKKGSATATIGLDYSAFEVGAKAVVQIAGQMATMIRDTLSVAAGNILAAAFNKGASAISSFFSSMRENMAAIFSTGEELANLAHATGMATGEYLKFKTAAEKGVTMTEAANLLGQNAAIMEKDAGLFREINLQLFAVGERIQGFWLGVADKIAPVINPLLDRLIALDLSEWGKAFATPIANAVAVITQLALDGQLWRTMGELAAAAFTYAGEVLGKVIGIYSSKGFSEALSSLWEGIKSGAVYLYEVLKNSIGKAFDYITLGIVIAGDKLAAIADEIATFTGFMSEEEAATRQSQRVQNQEGIANGIIANHNTPTLEIKTGGIIDELKKALDSTTFGTPELWEKLTGALEKFKTNEIETADRNSNTTAVQNFGVSSLAAIGGGGGVGMVNLIDHAAEQTRIQNESLEQTKLLVLYAKNAAEKPQQEYYSNGKVTIK